MPDKALTAEELEWAQQNAGAVRAAMAVTPMKPADNEYPVDGVEKATLLLTRSIKQKRAKIDAKEVDLRNRIKRYSALAASEIADSRQLGESWMAEDLREAEDGLRKFAAHRRSLEDKLARLQDDPEACFLPIGTIVRFTGSYGVEDSLDLSDRRNDYPVEGSVGVVTRLNYRDECFLGVSMRREFKTGWNDTCYPDYERVPTFIVDPEMLEVVGYATLPDGSEYRGFDFIETHQRDEGISGRDAEMILEADGLFWRLHDFGGTQGMECLQAYDDIAEMTWITGPLEKFVTSGTPKPR